MAKRLFILPLDSPRATLPVAGGKGASLAQLARAAFPVPHGFIVTAAAYRAFVEANGLEEPIAGISGTALRRDSAGLVVAAQAIREMFDRGLMPDRVADGIIRGYRDLTTGAGLPSPPLAVRSSATSEDRDAASAAGQQATFLGVRGEEALLGAVKRCWSSLWTDRAVAYRARRDADGPPQIAVVVQQMVPAKSAGVLFTVNPLNGNPDEILINAAWGLGETVVSGRVTPDALSVEKSTGQVKQLAIGDKAVMTVLTMEGTAEARVAQARRRKPVLSAEQIRLLARLAREIESHFGAPQDIEWAIAIGRTHILQSRPVTALLHSPDGRIPSESSSPEDRETSPGTFLRAASDVPGDDHWPAVDERPPRPFDLWTRAVVGEVWPNPVSPLMWSGVPVIIGDSIRHSLRGLKTPYMEKAQLAGRFYGRIYYNEGALAMAFSNELGLPASFVNEALGNRRDADHQRDGRFRPLRFVGRLPFLVRMAASQLGTGRELEALFPQIDHWFAEFGRQPLDQLSDRELWAEFSRWVERFKRAINLQAEISSIGITAVTLLEWLLARWLGRKELTMQLIGGLPGVYAAEMGPALWGIARSLREAGLAEVLLEQDSRATYTRLRQLPGAGPAMQLLDSFLERHGHRCPNEGEWLNPRWAEAPEGVIELVAGYLRGGDRVSPEAAQASQRASREKATAWVEANLDPIQRPVFRRVLARAQHGARLRDNGKHYYMKLALAVRRIDVSVGQRWAERGWLDRPEDIFFLTIPDVQRVIETGDPVAADLDLRRLVSERRRAFEYWSTVRAPEVIGPSGQPVESGGKDMPPALTLQGIPASGGRARGTARILSDPYEAARLGPCDILVTRATDPGWTPLFPLVAGLVIEVGGQLSHAAIVAREYGVPAVVNVRDATRRIREGQTIVVDGTAGRVYLNGTG